MKQPFLVNVGLTCVVIMIMTHVYFVERKIAPLGSSVISSIHESKAMVVNINMDQNDVISVDENDGTNVIDMEEIEKSLNSDTKEHAPSDMGGQTTSVVLDKNDEQAGDVVNTYENVENYPETTNLVLDSSDEQPGAVTTIKTTKIMAEYIDTKLNVTDRTKSVVSARFGLMEVLPGIIEEMQKINISIVVSHCDENVSWISDYIGADFSIKDIIIYSKCGKEVEGLEEVRKLTPNLDVVVLPNVGRCDHTYVYWIKQHYSSINKDTNGNDVVMFFKGNTRHHNHAIDHLLSYVSKTGFGCMSKAECPCEQCREDQLVPTAQHKRETLFKKGAKATYQRIDRDDTVMFASERYPLLKDWLKDMEFIIPNSKTLAVCYRGLFAIQKKQILNQSEESWEKMEASLSRGDNIVEGHYSERSWASILSDTDDETASAVDEVLSPHTALLSKQVTCGMKGVVYIREDTEIVAS